MSEENVEIVRSFYRAWARNDLPGPLELMDPEIEYVNPIRAVEPGTRRGLAAFSRAVEKVYEGWETWQMEPEQFKAVGARRRPIGGSCVLSSLSSTMAAPAALASTTTNLKRTESLRGRREKE